MSSHRPIRLKFVTVIVAALTIGMLPRVGSAQGGGDSQNRATDLADFDFLVAYLDRNYAGWETKVAIDSSHRARFSALVAAQRKDVASGRTPALDAMQVVVNSFHDEHTGVEPLDHGGSAPLTPGPSYPPPATADLSADRLARISSLPRRGIQGLWESVDGQYQVAVEPQGPRQWRAIVVKSRSPRWTRGAVKFTVTQSGSGLAATYLMGNFSPRRMAMLLGDSDRVALLRGDDGTRIWWSRPGTAPGLLRRVNPPSETFLERLSARTAWLRIDNFGPDNLPAITRALHDSALKVESFENLVIDLRDNGGGTDAAFEELFRMICSRPAYTPAVEFRATAENAAAFDRILASGEQLPPTVQSWVTDIRDRMRAAPGTWISSSGTGRSFEVVPCPAGHRLPAHVGILITGTASSAEQFIYLARQSNRVTLFGEPSNGVLDFSNVLSVDLPSGRFRLNYASSRSMRLPEEPIDGVGILPDVPIAPDQLDPVGYVQRWLEALSDLPARVGKE